MKAQGLQSQEYLEWNVEKSLNPTFCLAPLEKG